MSAHKNHCEYQTHMSLLQIDLRRVFSSDTSPSARQSFMTNTANINRVRVGLETTTPRVLMALLMIHAEREHVLRTENPLDAMLDDWCARLHAAVTSDHIDLQAVRQIVTCAGNIFDAWKRRDIGVVELFLRGNTHGLSSAEQQTWLSRLRQQPYEPQQQQQAAAEQKEQKINEPVLIAEYEQTVTKLREVRALVLQRCLRAQHDEFMREFDHRLRISDLNVASRAIIHLSRVDLGAILHYVVTVSMVLSESESQTCRQLLEKAISATYCPNPLVFMRTYVPDALDWCIDALTRHGMAARSPV